MRLRIPLRAGSIPQVPVGICPPILGDAQDVPMICGYAILDTGANRTYLAPRLIEQLGLKKIGMHQMVGATGSGTGEMFAATLSLTFHDEGRERERFFDIQAIAGSMLVSDTAPLAYVGRDVLVRLASMRLDFEAGMLELVANETTGREF